MVSSPRNAYIYIKEQILIQHFCRVNVTNFGGFIVWVAIGGEKKNTKTQKTKNNL